ncbi:MAG: 50S ribosomal protein L11 methyltransferase [Hyphomicrobiaceae bacterium]|nr:50S ribosomal protein L11 methyltransferase [Hyphomicrobiaceae bacterium]
MTHLFNPDAFIAATTHLQRTGLVPEIALHLATEPYRIFQTADEIGAEKPFWAFAWPGGQAVARFLLDNPHEVRGRRVLDIGTGSGLAAIAALKAGATTAIANDTDPIACAAARLNAAANGVSLETRATDLLATDSDVDLILVGEVFYEPEMAMRVTSFLERTRSRGVDLIFADRTSVRRPALGLELVTEVVAPLTPDLGMDQMERARIWRLPPTITVPARRRSRSTTT